MLFTTSVVLSLITECALDYTFRFVTNEHSTASEDPQLAITWTENLGWERPELVSSEQH